MDSGFLPIESLGPSLSLLDSCTPLSGVSWRLRLSPAFLHPLALSLPLVSRHFDNNMAMAWLSVRVPTPLSCAPGPVTRKLGSPAQASMGEQQQKQRQLDSSTNHAPRTQKELLIALLLEAHEALQKPENQELIKMQLSKLRQQGLSMEDTSLSSMRQFKELNVHKYVHSYVQASYLRSWLQKREIED